ncbi:MAG: transglycosylase SLT domain-containing protein, partial [Candidatus Delongbacteria bacterium]|nr:transglycosylase SLT domain-containing protein [Candidatus Delongbacteria bacterium]
ASGLWQLMPTTAKMYGLRADNFVDERNLLEKSTRAAAEHLKMLSQIFKDDPFLVIAAYNNGDSNVRSMIESQKSGGFWESRSNSETEFYVEKVILYKLILSNPEEYGFDSPHKNEERKYEMCTISLGSENLNFSDICSILNISYRELYKINPHIKFGSYKTSGIIGKYTSMDICIPEGSKDKLFSELKNRKLIANSTDGYFEDTIAKIEILEDIYEIKFNDNIESIAFKYGVDWRKLAEKNNLKFVTLSSGVETAETFKGQKLRIIR